MILILDFEFWIFDFAKPIGFFNQSEIQNGPQIFMVFYDFL